MSPKRKKDLMLLKGISAGGRGDYQTWVFAVAGFSLLLIAAYSLFNVVEEQIEEFRFDEKPMPDFSRIADVSERKDAFFEYLKPYVEASNREILEERTEILKLQQYFGRHGKLSGGRLDDLNELLASYDFEQVDEASDEVFGYLLRRADTVPESLVLAQAAIESGWGTSRFARQGNNLFGMWCYEPGCGIVPKRRPAGRTYEVAAYRSPRESFSAYIKNLNTNDSYRSLRDIRYAFRRNGAEPSGYDLAEGLVRYSQERWAYVDKVRNMILSNRLEEAI